MKVLFVFCEGPHDAHFIGRLLKASKQYKDYEVALKNYPSPLGKFISGKFAHNNIDEIRIGRLNNPLIPVCGLISENNEYLVFPISLGGMDQTEVAKSLLKTVQSSFASDILNLPDFDVSAVSILFIYDADARGLTDTETLWRTRFEENFPETQTLSIGKWSLQGDHRVALFVFTDAQGDQGTLEDNLIELFRQKDESLLLAATDIMENNFEIISTEGDPLAHETKKKKSILTICGQAEKKNAGSALTIVVRDTKLLDDVFDFNDPDAQWTKLLNLINEAFVAAPI